MNASSANLDGQKADDVTEEELDFHSADIVTQDTSTLFVNIDGAEQPATEPEPEPEKPKPVETPAPKERRAPKFNKKILIIVLIAVAAVAAIAGIVYGIYYFTHREEIEHEKTVEAVRDYRQEYHEILQIYRNTKDYDAAMASLQEKVDEAKNEKTKIAAKNGILSFMTRYSGDSVAVEDYYNSYCGEESEERKNMPELCKNADSTIEYYRKVILK